MTSRNNPFSGRVRSTRPDGLRASWRGRTQAANAIPSDPSIHLHTLRCERGSESAMDASQTVAGHGGATHRVTLGGKCGVWAGQPTGDSSKRRHAELEDDADSATEGSRNSKRKQ